MQQRKITTIFSYLRKKDTRRHHRLHDEANTLQWKILFQKKIADKTSGHDICRIRHSLISS